MAARNSIFTDLIQDYVLAHCTPPDATMGDLIAETRQLLPDRAVMQVSPEQAQLLAMLVRLSGARQIVEVGTFTGMSSLAMARAMPADGRLICFDVSSEFTAVAERYWQRAGVGDRIELRIGPAAQRLRELPAEPTLDLAFIDADKENYLTYWHELVPRVRPGGLLVADNVLWSGRVADPAQQDETTEAIRQFNQAVLADERVDVVLLPVSDGMTLAYRR